jgi:hypothetical protein
MTRRIPPKFVAFLAGVAIVSSPALPATEARVHTHASFEFVADASIETVFPLFGAERERVWAPDWDPRFVWPPVALDQEGMVFSVAHGERNAVWVNTVFDRSGHRAQYVYVLPDHFVTVIDVRLTAQQESARVDVTYERTALSAEADPIVRRMGDHDGASGPAWSAQINAYLHRD